MTSRIADRRHMLGQVPLEEYFSTHQDMETVLAAVRYKVVDTFLRATHPRTGRTTGRDNYIAGLSDRISNLTDYVQARTNLRHVFWHQHLSKVRAGSGLTRRQWDHVLAHIHRQMICRILIEMRDDQNLWRLDGDWCFSQLLRTEHDRAAKEAKAIYRDQRNWHGRPSTQGRRRAKQLRTAPGLSISTA